MLTFKQSNLSGPYQSPKAFKIFMEAVSLIPTLSIEQFQELIFDGLNCKPTTQIYVDAEDTLLNPREKQKRARHTMRLQDHPIFKNHPEYLIRAHKQPQASMHSENQAKLRL